MVDGVGQKRHSDGDLYAQTTNKVCRGEDMEDRCQLLEEIRSLTGVYGRGDGFRLRLESKLLEEETQTFWSEHFK
jgi:hypothetical protein